MGRAEQVGRAGLEAEVVMEAVEAVEGRRCRG